MIEIIQCNQLIVRMLYVGGIYLSRFEVIYQWSLRFSKMDIQSQYFEMSSESIFGYLMFVLELSEEFINRGLNGGWPDDCLPYLPQIIIMRDLVRMLIGIVGDLPLMGAGGTVADAWRNREDSRRGGGRGGGMGGGGNGGMGGVGGADGSIDN